MENKEQVIKDIMENKWSNMESLVPFMSLYLHHEEIPKEYETIDVIKVMSECLSMLFGEFNNTLGKLNKYEPKHYTDSDFVDMVIESIGENKPDQDDREIVLKYVEDFRNTLWGHVIYHANRYIKLYVDTQAKQVVEANESFDIFNECMTIVMVECFLRIYERE